MSSHVRQPKPSTILGSKLPKYVRSHILASGVAIEENKRYIYKRAEDAYDGRAWVYVLEANKSFYFDECQ